MQDADGKHVTTAVVSIPGAVENALSDAAVSPRRAFWSDGRTTTFIQFISNAEKTLQLIRTSPFTARRICFSADGTF